MPPSTVCTDSLLRPLQPVRSSLGGALEWMSDRTEACKNRAPESMTVPLRSMSHHGQSTDQDLVQELPFNLQLYLEVVFPSSESRRFIPARHNLSLFVNADQVMRDGDAVAPVELTAGVGVVLECTTCTDGTERLEGRRVAVDGDAHRFRERSTRDGSDDMAGFSALDSHFGGVLKLGVVCVSDVEVTRFVAIKDVYTPKYTSSGGTGYGMVTVVTVEWSMPLAILDLEQININRYLLSDDWVRRNELPLSPDVTTDGL
ncbi:MAG: hypothetical protein Q9210_000199 [Variospora velana]